MGLYERIKLPLKVATFLHIFSTTAQILPPLKGISRVLAELGALIYLFFKLRRQGFSRFSITGALLIPHFRLGRQTERHSVLRHLIELITLNRLGLRTPPINAPHNSLRSVLKHGPWQRHKFEIEATAEVGPIHCHLIPVKLSNHSLGSMLCFTSDPAIIEQIMTDKDTFPSRNPKGFQVDNKEGMLLYETGPKWALHRKIVSQFLTEKNLAVFADETIVDQIKVMMRKWDMNSGPVEVHHDLCLLTYEIITRFVTGVDLKHTANQTVSKEDFLITKVIDYLIRWGPILSSFPDWVPLPMKYKLRRLVQSMDDEIIPLIKDANAKQDSNVISMLSAMQNARLENGEAAMSPHELLEEVQTMFGAGHETTSNTLCWAMLLLARNPSKLEKLQEEADRIVANESATYDEAKELKYATMVIYEALRLYPTVPSFPRTCVKDTRLGGYDVPAGSIVFVSCAALNMSPEQWDNPEVFSPERFTKLPELKMSKPVGVPDGEKFGYVPFGAGQRTCVGQRFALMEAVQILGSIAKNFTWTLVDGMQQQVHEVADVTLGPKYGLLMNIQRR